MGDINRDATSLSLPPGCRFYPSDEQLVCYYLSLKNGGDHLDAAVNVIKEISLYNFDPFDLPETSCFRFGRGGRRRHWFCFVTRVLKDRRTRKAGSGYWKRKGRVRVVVDGSAGKVVVGTRKCFVFYLGDSSKTAMRTEWFMYEYALPDRPTAAFVLCRVFVKSPKGNDMSDNMLSSCAEESVTVRHIGIQCDRITTSATEEEIQDETKLRSPGHVNTGATFLEGLSAEDVLDILEGGFLELNDLVCPISGID